MTDASRLLLAGTELALLVTVWRSRIWLPVFALYIALLFVYALSWRYGHNDEIWAAFTPVLMVARVAVAAEAFLLAARRMRRLPRSLAAVSAIVIGFAPNSVLWKLAPDPNFGSLQPWNAYLLVAVCSGLAWSAATLPDYRWHSWLLCAEMLPTMTGNILQQLIARPTPSHERIWWISTNIGNCVSAACMCAWAWKFSRRSTRSRVATRETTP